jgi:hypothetical protein
MKNPPGFRANFGVSLRSNTDGLLLPMAAVRFRRKSYSQCVRTCMRRGGSLAACANSCGFRTASTPAAVTRRTMHH